ncbi:hypothetical protein OS493_031797 [Desmophyllum pertusum]|uniref:Uncharacterized protein n=1 Tax=Desmophyllum pertusum TaxID=174260 RepID=A0A9X0CR74_9CNID|nr:hypothetical protein OS493_031797 [Desmophyllum pertusum]
MLNAMSPPDFITKHVHHWLKYGSGITKEESVVSIDLWDFAGQDMYYASHPVFLSSRSVFVLVHNLSKQLNAPAQPCVRQGIHDIRLDNPNDETNVENLQSWLATIHSVKPLNEETDDNAQRRLPYLPPPVFIVGTHADQPVEDIAVIKMQIQQRISGKEYGKHVIRPIFSIDNTKRSSSLPQGREHQAGTGKVLVYPSTV